MICGKSVDEKKTAKDELVYGTFHAAKRTSLHHELETGGLQEWTQRRDFVFLGTGYVAGCRL